MNYVILRKTEKRFSIDDLWTKENLISWFKIEDKDFLDFEQDINLEISKIHDEYMNSSKEERIEIIRNIIKEIENTFSIEYDDWLFLEEIDFEKNKKYSYDVKLVKENHYKIIREDWKVIYEELFNDRWDSFVIFIKTYRWNDIDWIIKLFNENFVWMSENETNTLFETKLWNLKKNELDIKEQESFNNWEEIVIWTKRQELNVEYLLDLHKFMFQDLYDWAWKLRNIEVSFWWKEWTKFYLIESELKSLFNNFEYRFNFIKNEEELIEFLVDFEYQFICIHPFNNTNWRISRLLSYKYVLKFWYYWRPNVYDNRERRNEYIDAIKECDKWNKEKLKWILKNYLTNFKFIWA